MKTPTSPLSIFERLNAWMQGSIMIKLLSIGFLTLILLIPSAWVDHLIHERYNRSTEVFNEITSKWSGQQTLTGPILIMPYKEFIIIKNENGKHDVIEKKREAYFLPDELNYDGKINPTTRHRGMYDAVVYTSDVEIKSEFRQLDFEKLGIAAENILWEEARIVFGLSDLRGIIAPPNITINNQPFSAEQISSIDIMVSTHESKTESQAVSSPPKNSPGFEIKPRWKNAETFQGNIQISLALKGSKALNFFPVGKTTNVALSGIWQNPSFTGEFLPNDPTINDTTFQAQWSVLDFNRPFPQQWTDAQNIILEKASFGVTLLVPVDQYQKTIRTAKYGVLIILLTFVSLLLTEIMQGIKIHPFQYILIGASLVIYYTLLLSLAEHIGFNAAYGITSLATVSLVGLYSLTFTQNKKVTLGLIGILCLFYTFIYIIVLQQDYSLLIGSIGLFITIATLMYTSRKINWYNL